MAEEQKGEVLNHEDVPQPGHPSTKLEANKGIGSDYATDRAKDSVMPSLDTMNKVNSIMQRKWTTGR